MVNMEIFNSKAIKKMAKYISLVVFLFIVFSCGFALILLHSGGGFTDKPLIPYLIGFLAVVPFLVFIIILIVSHFFTKRYYKKLNEYSKNNERNVFYRRRFEVIQQICNSTEKDIAAITKNNLEILKETFPLMPKGGSCFSDKNIDKLKDRIHLLDKYIATGSGDDVDKLKEIISMVNGIPSCQEKNTEILREMKDMIPEMQICIFKISEQNINSLKDLLAKILEQLSKMVFETDTANN